MAAGKHPLDPSLDGVLDALRERAKELDCLYQIEELLGRHDLPLADVLQGVARILPLGWQFPAICQARIRCDGAAYDSGPYAPPVCGHSAAIRVEDSPIGSVEVSYASEIPLPSDDCFLEKEHKLIRTAADRIGQTIQHRKLRQMRSEWESARKELGGPSSSREWRVIVDLIRRTDPPMLHYLSRQMLYHLFWNGIPEARELVRDGELFSEEGLHEEANSPIPTQTMEKMLGTSDAIFELAGRHLSPDDILASIQKWIQDKRTSFLIKAVDNVGTSLEEIIDAVMLYKTLADKSVRLPSVTDQWLKVALIRRFFSRDLAYIRTAKQNVEVTDFHELVQRIIYPAGCNGDLGGKAAGLFLAKAILSKDNDPVLDTVRFPKTWHLPADALTVFLHLNELESINEQKYKDLDQVRLEYPNIVHLLKASRFPGDVVKGLSAALDDFGDVPIIVRSSSLLEDRVGASFAGKYKSLFLANRGTKAERLQALLQAIAEVYASMFGPDPIEYRSAWGLLDFYEKMAVMVQEVVGTRVGPYFFPAFSGVAFSNNEFRWSPRIKREDGLVRLVPGLGTRAVDRVSDDYPVLVSPGAPQLRANATPEEILRYSPKKLDAINLDTGRFETVDVQEVLKHFGNDFPLVGRIVSVCRDGGLPAPARIQADFERDDAIVTFDGLIQKTPFVKQIQTLLARLQERIGHPVDVEFASNGRHLYLLQCRSQSIAGLHVPSPIPTDIPGERMVFSANRFISNGAIPDITHVVYVDPDAYAALTRRSDLLDVGRAIGMLNRLLPKRQFILMGPGRWGSRGDIKLGVQVTYSDINNTAVLIEIARRKGNYVPELSFGTHFFQDLVEASIRYLPLYPDDDGVEFNREFLAGTPNVLTELLPAFEHLTGVVRVLDVPKSAGGRILRILLNADEIRAVGFLAEPSTRAVPTSREAGAPPPPVVSKDHWRWRLRMAEQIAERLDPARFGVQGLYLFGSTGNATAGPGSDIDLIIHFTGTPEQRADLMAWLQGWSSSLAEMNYLRTGHQSTGLLDVQFVTDEDITLKRGYAAKIDAATNPARPLRLRSAE